MPDPDSRPESDLTTPPSGARGDSVPFPAREASLGGWGNHPVAPGRISSVDRESGAKAAVAAHAGAGTTSGGLVARGLGRAYGDSAINGGGLVLEQRPRRRYLAFDEQTGVLHAEAGASLADIIRTFGPRGWFPGTVPGTKFVTLGGAIAADVHGKNHHVDGSFSTFVESFDLLLASGEVRRVTRDTEPTLFAATVGGMGMTGIVLTAAVRLRRVGSGYYRVRNERARNYEHMLELLAASDDAYRYSVAWLDGIASGDSLGRGVLMLGNDAAADELPAKLRPRAFDPPLRRTKTLPVHLPGFALNPLTMRMMNTGYWMSQRTGESFVDYDRYFFPLDAVNHWNRGYGKRGFVQYQALLPDDAAHDGTRAILEAIAASGRASFLSVLKRSGPAGEGMLSFLFPGVTLALDIPNGGAPVRRLCERLDAMLLDHGGRLYLAKDALASAETIRAMYPRLDEFLAVKRRIDPDGVFTSSQARRVGLDPFRGPDGGSA